MKANTPRWRRSRGFTIIELLVVMTILVILASVGMTQYRNSVRRAEEATLKENLFRMRDAIDQFYADKNKYPADLADLVSEGYIREVPTDPLTKSKDTWTTTQAEPDANNPASQVGIYDVKSGSELTALDGTRYADWD
ncbi:MAG: prepilin-type N-terminal cleavage/methylation domain-containing protein [Vicinamibacterales bacterium]